MFIVVCKNDIEEVEAHIKSLPRSNRIRELLKIINEKGYLWWLSNFIPITMQIGEIMKLEYGVYAHMGVVGLDVEYLNLKQKYEYDELASSHSDTVQIYLTIRKSVTDAYSHPSRSPILM